MALLATFLQDRHHVAVVGHGPVGFDLPLDTDRAANGRGDRLADRLAGEHFIERLFEIVALYLLILLQPGGKAVVDAAAIAQDQVAVEHEGLGRLFGLEGGGIRSVRIVKHGKAEFEFASLAIDRIGCLRLAGAHSNERDPLHAVALGHFGQSRRIGGRNRALERHEHEDRALRAGDVVNRAFLSRVIDQCDAINFLSQLGGDNFCRLPGHIRQTKNHRGHTGQTHQSHVRLHIDPATD